MQTPVADDQKPQEEVVEGAEKKEGSEVEAPVTPDVAAPVEETPAEEPQQ